MIDNHIEDIKKRVIDNSYKQIAIIKTIRDIEDVDERLFHINEAFSKTEIFNIFLRDEIRKIILEKEDYNNAIDISFRGGEIPLEEAETTEHIYHVFEDFYVKVESQYCMSYDSVFQKAKFFYNSGQEEDKELISLYGFLGLNEKEVAQNLFLNDKSFLTKEVLVWLGRDFLNLGVLYFNSINSSLNLEDFYDFLMHIGLEEPITNFYIETIKSLQEQ